MSHLLWEVDQFVGTVKRSVIVLNVFHSPLHCLEGCDRQILRQTWKSLEHCHHFLSLWQGPFVPTSPSSRGQPAPCGALVLRLRSATSVHARQCVHTGRGSAALQLRQLLFVQCSATRSSINSPFCGSNWITANRGKQIQIKTKVYPSIPLYLPSFVARLYKCCNINRNIQQGEYQWCHIGAALPEGTFQLQYWTCAVSVVILTVVKSLLGKVCCWFVVWWADSYCALFPYR